MKKILLCNLLIFIVMFFIEEFILFKSLEIKPCHSFIQTYLCRPVKIFEKSFKNTMSNDFISERKKLFNKYKYLHFRDLKINFRPTLKGGGEFYSSFWMFLYLWLEFKRRTNSFI